MFVAEPHSPQSQTLYPPNPDVSDNTKQRPSVRLGFFLPPLAGSRGINMARLSSRSVCGWDTRF